MVFIACTFILHMCLVPDGQEKVSDPLPLELQVVVSPNVGAEN